MPSPPLRLRRVARTKARLRCVHVHTYGHHCSYSAARLTPCLPPWPRPPGKGFLKDLILRRDEELLKTFAGFGSNSSFLQDLHGLIGEFFVVSMKLSTGDVVSYTAQQQCQDSCRRTWRKGGTARRKQTVRSGGCFFADIAATAVAVHSCCDLLVDVVVTLLALLWTPFGAFAKRGDVPDLLGVAQGRC